MRSWRSDAGCRRGPRPVTCGQARETRGRAAGMKSDLAGWCFAGPALLVIAVFFVVPVAAALALSLTDFDIYAIADLANLRLVWLHNYIQLLKTPLFWTALGNTLYFVVVAVPLSIAVSLATAMLLDSELVLAKGAFATALTAPAV